MGREIRRVPPNWEHPRDERGYYCPMFDRDFETEVAAWDEQDRQWREGVHPDQKRFPGETSASFTAWDGPRPDPAYHRPAWTEEEATAYQVYEDVTEGTPISPVLATEGELYQWLREQGHSEHASREFIKYKWAPSMIVDMAAESPVLAMGIDTYDYA